MHISYKKQYAGWDTVARINKRALTRPEIVQEAAGWIYEGIGWYRL